MTEILVSFCQFVTFGLFLVIGFGVVWFGWLRWEFKKLDSGKEEE